MWLRVYFKGLISSIRLAGEKRPAVSFSIFLFPPALLHPSLYSRLAPSISLPTSRRSSLSFSPPRDRFCQWIRKVEKFCSPVAVSSISISVSSPPFHPVAPFSFVFSRADWTLRARIRESFPRREGEKVKAKWKSATPFFKIVREIHRVFAGANFHRFWNPGGWQFLNPQPKRDVSRIRWQRTLRKALEAVKCITMIRCRDVENFGNMIQKSWAGWRFKNYRLLFAQESRSIFGNSLFRHFYFESREIYIYDSAKKLWEMSRSEKCPQLNFSYTRHWKFLANSFSWLDASNVNCVFQDISRRAAFSRSFISAGEMLMHAISIELRHWPTFKVSLRECDEIFSRSHNVSRTP